MLPSVQIQKIQSNAGTVRPSPILPAMIAPSYYGMKNQPAQFTRPTDLQVAFLEGPLVDAPSYFMSEASLPVLAIAATAATAPTYGTLIDAITGTATPSLGSAVLIQDDYQIKGPTGLFGFVFTALNDIVLGTTGGSYSVSFDGGTSSSPPLALGTSLTIAPVLPNTGADSGVRITLGTTSQTLMKGDTISVVTTCGRMQTTDLAGSLEALRISKQPWDLVHVHGETNATLIGQIDTWLAALELVGKFKGALVNTRFKDQITPETEGAYATALATVMASTASSRVCPSADGGAVTSTITGVTKRQPTSLALLARAEVLSVGVDPAEVDLGPIGGFNIDDDKSNPLFHDENIFPGLDDLRLTTLRSFGDREGVFICNANLDSSSGSDYVYLQHARTMNLGCATVFSVLTTLLSQGVRINLATGFILELQAAKWEGIATKAVQKVLAGQVSGVKVTISRTDILTGNGPQTLTVTLAIASLKYVKTFKVTSEFVNQIP